jgi:hypothetical protein
MGIGILNAAETTAEDFESKHGHALAEDEYIHLVYRTIRDYIAFTERRILYINAQGITGRKKEYLSVPYRAINAFAVETAGTFDLDAEVKIFISGHTPIKFRIARNEDVRKLHELLTEAVNM